MKKCPICNKLISPSTLSYIASAGFCDIDGTFHDDAIVIIHAGCLDYTFNPFEVIEKSMKDGEL